VDGKHILITFRNTGYTMYCKMQTYAIYTMGRKTTVITFCRGPPPVILDYSAQ